MSADLNHLFHESEDAAKARAELEAEYDKVNDFCRELTSRGMSMLLEIRKNMLTIEGASHTPQHVVLKYKCDAYKIRNEIMNVAVDAAMGGKVM